MHSAYIGLCTAQRPVMLRKCLDSLAAQRLPDGFKVGLIVVDNEAEPNNRPIVDEFAATCPFPVHYFHEPRRGIPMARNRVLDEAIKLRADWIAMLDDDETADPSWLAALMAPEYLHVHILGGAHSYRYPEPRPFWAPPRAKKEKLATKAQMGNIRLSKEVLKHGLRFNDTIALANGEDSEFFAEAKRMGFEIHRVFDAVTTETAHLDRLTYRYQIYRKYCSAAANMRIAIGHNGFSRAAAKRLPLACVWIVSGIVELAASPLFLIVGLDRFKKRALVAGQKIAKATGRLAAIVGHIPQPYSKISGY